MKRVERISVSRNLPCVAIVHLTPVETLTRRVRVQAAKVRGIPPEQCGRRSTVILDGEALCISHAGQRALRILEQAGGS